MSTKIRWRQCASTSMALTKAIAKVMAATFADPGVDPGRHGAQCGRGPQRLRTGTETC